MQQVWLWHALASMTRLVTGFAHQSGEHFAHAMREPPYSHVRPKQPDGQLQPTALVVKWRYSDVRSREIDHQWLRHQLAHAADQNNHQPEVGVVDLQSSPARWVALRLSSADVL